MNAEEQPREEISPTPIFTPSVQAEDILPSYLRPDRRSSTGTYAPLSRYEASLIVDAYGIDPDPQKLSLLERVVWGKLLDGSAKDDIEKAKASVVASGMVIGRKGTLDSVIDSLGAKGFYPPSPDLLQPEQRLYAREVSDFIGLVKERPEELPPGMKFALDILQRELATRKPTNLRQPLAYRYKNPESYQQALTAIIGDALSISRRDLRVQVFQIPTDLKYLQPEAEKIIDWLYTLQQEEEEQKKAS